MDMERDGLDHLRPKPPEHLTGVVPRASYEIDMNTLNAEITDLRQQLAAARAESYAINRLMPPTFYADRPLWVRVEYMIDQWQRLIPACERLEAERDAAVWEREEGRKALQEIVELASIPHRPPAEDIAAIARTALGSREG